jgi:hypothetical protein
MNRIWIFRVSL